MYSRMPGRRLLTVCALVACAALSLSGIDLDSRGQPPTEGQRVDKDKPLLRLGGGGFGGRTGATREKLLRDFGGNTRSEAAVAAGLKWLSRHQAEDGSWSLHAFHEDGKCNCGDRGAKDDVLGTALALLPFLGAGQSHKKPAPDNAYAKTVERGLKFLVTRQWKEGKIGASELGHALATIALCEAYGMSADPDLKGPAERAVSYLLGKQQKDGTWPGNPKGAGAAAVDGAWQFMALKCAQQAGLDIPNRNLAQVNDALDARQEVKDRLPAALAAHWLCRQYHAWGNRHPVLHKGVAELSKRAPDANRKDIEYYYFASQVLYHWGDEPWQAWNPKMRDLLIDTQDQGQNPDQRDQKGSWSPTGDPLAPFGGRLMQTSLALLTLEVYYRYLPLRTEPNR